MGFLNEPRTIEEMEEKKQMMAAKLEVEEKKALIAEAKRRYGADWRKFFKFGGEGGMKSGIDWSSLKFRL